MSPAHSKRQKFHPSKLVRGGISQTIVGHFSNKKVNLATKDFPISLKDGDKLICKLDGDNLNKNAPTLILFHGLTGCSESSYMRSISKRATERNIRVLRFNHRGCGPGGIKYAKGIYHSGRLEDMLTAIEKVIVSFPDSDVFLCGFSLSGNMLLNILSLYRQRIGELKNIKSAMSVCPPVDLNQSTVRLSKNKIFDYYFGKNLLKHLKSIEKTHGIKLIKNSKKIMTVREFDNTYTAELSGSRSREDYYKKHSSLQNISSICLPTEVLLTLDDPIVNSEVILSKDQNKYLQIEVHPKGGHLGFINAHTIPGFGKRWMDYRVIDWVKRNISESI